MSSETQNSSSDVLPSNSNKITSASDDKPSTAAEYNPASDDKPSASKHFQDNQASDDKSSAVKDKSASDDKPSAADEDKSASDDKPSVADEDKPVSDGKPSAADENKSASDDKPSAVDENKLVLGDKQLAVDEDKPASDNKPSATDENKLASDGKPSEVDENKPALYGKQSAVDNDKSASDSKPSVVDENKGTSDGKPLATNENKLASDDKQATVDENKPALDGKPSATDENKLASDNKPSAVDEDKPTSDGKPSAIDENKLVSEDKQSAVDKDKLASNAKQSVDEEDHASDDEHIRAEANLASTDKQSVADKDGPKVQSEPSSSKEITPAKDDQDSLDNHHKPQRSKSEPIPELNNKDTSSSSHLSKIDSLCNLIKEELEYMKGDPEQLKKYGNLIEDQLNEANKQLEQLGAEIEKGGDEQDEEMKALLELKKRVTKLKAKFPSKAKIHSLEKEMKKARELKEDSNLITEKRKRKLPNVYNNPTFNKSETFGDFLSLFRDLDSDVKKLCLLCFAVFPEDAKIKTRVMIYWWIAEGFIPSDSIAPEEEGCKFLQEYTDKGFIIPVPEKPGFEVHKYKLHPLARVVLISLAESARFFNFNKDGHPTEKYSRSLRACLVGEGLSDVSQLEKLHMLFNVNEPILEFKPEWFPKMENINILYLGRWQSEEQHHIEIEDSKFLEGLQHLKFLKFLSLQGVSRVTELPDSIKKLGRLMILDLRACHNLEKIPAGIGYLKNLRYLDMSDCYLIDHMPKELSLLGNLLVLKGFVAGDPHETKGKKSCTLMDLASKLKNLEKLGIYTGVMEFPSHEDLKALSKFTKLESLTIAWGSDATGMGGKDGKQKLVNNDQQQKGRADKKTQEKSLDEFAASPQKANHAPDPLVANAKQPKDNKTQEKKTVKFAASPQEANDAPDPLVASAKQAQDTGIPAVTENKNQENVRNEEVQEEKNTSSATKRMDTLKKSPSKFFLRSDQRPTTGSPPSLPATLKKLDLKCYPQLLSPDWLKPNRLTNLRKLYIRGGRLRDLGEVYEWTGHKVDLTKKKWEQVEILRLKFLEEMEIRWKDLRHLFPKLTYLEKVNCPKVTLFPCNDSGVWIDKTKIRSNQEKPAESQQREN